LILHPSFFAILEIENEFGLVLSVLLGAVLIISSIWIEMEKEDMDRKIAVQYGLAMTD
jgi:hypothetical protein